RTRVLEGRFVKQYMEDKMEDAFWTGFDKEAKKKKKVSKPKAPKKPKDKAKGVLRKEPAMWWKQTKQAEAKEESVNLFEMWKQAQAGGTAEASEEEAPQTLLPFLREKLTMSKEAEAEEETQATEPTYLDKVRAALGMTKEAEEAPPEEPGSLFEMWKEAKKKKGEKWIQKAIKKPDALHDQMGIARGKKIPPKRLAKAAKKGGKLGQRARLAETLKGLSKKKKKAS
ncbi:MAG: hypothetical protein JSW03_08710, partial [Candidatus Eiseniibacteriota bacterium]